MVGLAKQYKRHVQRHEETSPALVLILNVNSGCLCHSVLLYILFILVAEKVAVGKLRTYTSSSLLDMNNSFGIYSQDYNFGTSAKNANSKVCAVEPLQQ